MDTNFTDNFLVTKKIKLKDFGTSYNGKLNKEEGLKMLADEKAKLRELQEVLYADGSQSLLIILQAMDAAGKDSLIEHVFGGVNPQGCEVTSFKTPTSQDYQRDFLFRHIVALPEKGKIGIFNRSHYESVLVCKVHPEYNLSEKTWKNVDQINDEFWKNRYKSIRNFEQHLAENGTKVVKLFLHVSKDEQKKRFLDRINEPEKNWKFSASDVSERQLWNRYMNAYEDAINETASETNPWHIIPADQKWFGRVTAIQIIIEALESMNLSYPKVSKETKSKFSDYKKALENED